MANSTISFTGKAGVQSYPFPPGATLVSFTVNGSAGTGSISNQDYLTISSPATINQGDAIVVTYYTAGQPFLSFPVAIANGASLSGAIDLGVGRLFGIAMDPTAWTAAALTFQVSVDGVNYFNLFDNTGTEINWTVLAQQFITAASPVEWQGIRWLKVRSGTSAAPINQGAARSLTIIAVP